MEQSNNNYLKIPEQKPGSLIEKRPVDKTSGRVDKSHLRNQSPPEEKETILRESNSPRKKQEVTINTDTNTVAETYSPDQYNRIGTKKTSSSTLKYTIEERGGRFHVVDKKTNQSVGSYEQHIYAVDQANSLNDH